MPCKVSLVGLKSSFLWDLSFAAIGSDGLRKAEQERWILVARPLLKASAAKQALLGAEMSRKGKIRARSGSEK